LRRRSAGGSRARSARPEGRADRRISRGCHDVASSSEQLRSRRQRQSQHELNDSNQDDDAKAHDTHAARRFFTTTLRAHGDPAEVVTDRAWTLRAVIDELIPAAFHNTEQYANKRIEADHGQLKSRLRPMRGLKRDCSARVVMRGHAFMQNLRRGHYELGIDTRRHRRVTTSFTELARTI
jgi:hypothetical protein